MESQEGSKEGKMVETSPKADVQALRAIFNQKDNPIISVLPQGVTQRQLNIIAKGSTQNETSLEPATPVNVSKSPSPVLPQSNSSPNTSRIRPPVHGPKPFTKFSKQPQTSSVKFQVPTTVNGSSNNNSIPIENGSTETNKNVRNSTDTGMPTVSIRVKHVNEHSNSGQDSRDSVSQCKAFITASFSDSSNFKENIAMSPSATNGVLPNLKQSPNKNLDTSLSSVVSSDSCITSPSKLRFRKCEMPPKEKLGPAPLKPVKPPHLKLPVLPAKLSEEKKIQPPPRTKRASQLVTKKPQPPVPSRTPPPPPNLPPRRLLPSTPSHEAEEEEDELYGDTKLLEEKEEVSSPIPEYTEEEEMGRADQEELYADTGDYLQPSKLSSAQKPAEDLQEELYHDGTTEEMYVEMPSDRSSDYQDTQFYMNKKPDDRTSKDYERKAKREQKEKEKKEKEFEKLRRKFGLTGKEDPLDSGWVKSSSRGGKFDLSVKKGDKVLILRMENNPPGKWLVRNDKGEVGYAELTNIEVDAESIKSVMKSRKQSMTSLNEELYNDTLEDEAIYEETM